MKIPKFIQESKKKKKKEHQGDEIGVGSDLKNKVIHAFDMDEFWDAKRTSNKIWKRKYAP